MITFDPFKFYITNILTVGPKQQINQQNLVGFISKNQINQIVKNISVYEEKLIGYSFYLLDTTPFNGNFENIDIFINELNKFSKFRPILIIKSPNLVQQIKNNNSNKSPFVLLIFDIQGNFLEITGGSTEIDDINKETIKNFFSITQYSNLNLHDVRKTISNYKLMDLLWKNNCIEIPYPNNHLFPITRIAGRYYFEMTNTMLTSCYINIKKLGLNYKSLIDIGYELLHNVLNNFCDSENEDNIYSYNATDAFVTSNNSSLFLSSFLQATLYKPIIAIDKLGPIPTLKIHNDMLHNTLRNKNITILSEVISTGSEIDRTIMFLNSMGVKKINRIIGLYNLEIGKPLLYNENNGIRIESLCTPKEEINYVYRSK